jgi:hypothetical protein
VGSAHDHALIQFPHAEKWRWMEQAQNNIFGIKIYLFFHKQLFINTNYLCQRIAVIAKTKDL